MGIQMINKPQLCLAANSFQMLWSGGRVGGAGSSKMEISVDGAEQHKQNKVQPACDAESKSPPRPVQCSVKSRSQH